MGGLRCPAADMTMSVTMETIYVIMNPINQKYMSYNIPFKVNIGLRSALDPDRWQPIV